jgi:hypothetical protein
MRVHAAILSVVLTGAPVAAAADRGALTLDLGPSLSLLNATPSEGAGSATLATGGGGTVGLRYALSNTLEIGGVAVWEASADYFHSGVAIATSTGRPRGTLEERAQRYGAMAGVHYIRGYVWRLHLGAELGWRRETFTRRDLLDVSDPSNVHSFGLGLRDQTSNSLILAPVAGVEWQFADHWSVSVMPRVQFLVGGTSRVGLLVPVTVGYSWFVF